MNKTSFTFSSLLYATLLIFVILTNTPYSELSLEGNIKKYVQSIFPQGWEFFTLNPRSSYNIVYSLKEKKLNELDFKNASSNSYFGISKINRIRNIELEVLLSNIDSSKFISCSSFDEMLWIADTISEINIINNTNVKKMSGTYIVRKTTPIPWAWHSSNNDLFMPSRIVKIRINEKQ